MPSAIRYTRDAHWTLDPGDPLRRINAHDTTQPTRGQHNCHPDELTGVTTR